MERWNLRKVNSLTCRAWGAAAIHTVAFVSKAWTLFRSTYLVITKQTSPKLGFRERQALKPVSHALLLVPLFTGGFSTLGLASEFPGFIERLTAQASSRRQALISFYSFLFDEFKG